MFYCRGNAYCSCLTSMTGQVLQPSAWEAHFTLPIWHHFLGSSAVLYHWGKVPQLRRQPAKLFLMLPRDNNTDFHRRIIYSCFNNTYYRFMILEHETFAFLSKLPEAACHSLHKGDTKQVREKLQGAHKFQFQISDTHWPKKGFPSFGYQGTKLYILIPDLSRESRRGLSWQLLFWILPEGALSYWEQSGTWPQRHYCKNCRRKSWESS